MDSYCVGIATDPQPEDRLRFYDWPQALAKARQRAECDRNVPIAIWGEKYELVRLFLVGMEFQED